MKGFARRSVAAGAILTLGGCTGAVCPLPGEHPALLVRLYFGRDIAGGAAVTDAEWTAFGRTVLSPAFPEGFTIFTAQGQWQDARGTIVREASSVVEHVGPVAPETVASIAATYKRRFHQEAVGAVSMHVCANFSD